MQTEMMIRKYLRIFIRNGDLLAVSLRAAPTLLSLVSIRVLSSLLNSEVLAIWLAALGVVSNASFLDLGVSLAAVQIIPGLNSKDKQREFYTVCFLGQALVFVLGGCLMLVAILSGLIGINIFGFGTAVGGYQQTIFNCAICALIIANITHLYWQRMLLADNKNLHSSVLSAASGVAMLSGGICGALFIGDSEGMLLSAAVMQILTVGPVGAAYARKRIKFGEIKLGFGVLARYLRVGGFFVYMQVASVIAYLSDQVLVTRYALGPKSITFIGLSKIYQIAPWIVSIILMPWWPKLIERKANTDRGAFKAALRHFLIMSLCGGSGLVLFSYFASDTILGRLLPHHVASSRALEVACACWSVLCVFGYIMSVVLNVLDKRRIQMVCVSVFAALSVLTKVLVLAYGREQNIDLLIQWATNVSYILSSVVPLLYVALGAIKHGRIVGVSGAQ